MIADVRRQTPAARLAMTAGFRSQIDRIASAITETQSPHARRAAIGAWASLVGALVLARTIDDPVLSDEILRETRHWIGGKADLDLQGEADRAPSAA